MRLRIIVGCCSALVVLSLASPAWSEAKLTGVVVRDSEHGEPATGVQVFAQGANPTTTGNDGGFVLVFPQGYPGQDVSILVKYSGWDVVNHIQLNLRLPANSNARALEIIICPSAEREQRRAEFYIRKGNQAVDRVYERKLAELEYRLNGAKQEVERLVSQRERAMEQLAELERRHAATEQERDRLLGEHDRAVEQAKAAALTAQQLAQDRDKLLREQKQALDQVQEWAHQAVSRDPDGDSIYRDALHLFIDGKADEALRLLAHSNVKSLALTTRPERIIGPTLAGVGAVSVFIGLGFGAAARSSWADARTAGCDKTGACPTPMGQQSVNTSSSQASWADRFFIAGLVTAAMGAAVWFVPWPHSGAESTVQHLSLHVGRNSISFRGDF